LAVASEGCDRKSNEISDELPASATVIATQAHASATAVATAAATAPAAAAASPCPSDTVLAEGLYCPELEQRCERAGSSDDACQRYAEPSRCLVEQKQLLRVCVDRYEWPNQLGQKPLVLVGYDEAQALCRSVGKRLCDESEWLLACEGEQHLPYSYGYERDPTRCVIDRLAIKPNRPLAAYDRCMDDEACREAFGKIDQREPSGSFRACISPVGAHDMTGNVAEWVSPLRPGPGQPFVGGAWGPGPNRCRTTQRSSNASEMRPDVGFRCCRNANPD
jgi:hypothetical protein